MTLERGRRAARVRGGGRSGQGQAGHHRPAREGHGGERAGGDELRAVARRRRSGSTPISTRRSTSTFTSRSSSARTDPSAGVTMATSLASALIKVPVRARPGDDRRDHAARARDADRRSEGEAPRGAPQRHHDRHHARRRIAKTCGKYRGACSRRRASSSWSTWTTCCARRFACRRTPRALLGAPRGSAGSTSDGELVVIPAPEGQSPPVPLSTPGPVPSPKAPMTGPARG